MQTVVAVASTGLKDKYSVGTLRYTKRGLFILFAWLLWGDFCFMLMEKALPLIYPLFLANKLHASTTTVTVLMQSIPQLIGVVLCPAISFRSDRTRSRWGRRIPYMTFTAPFLCLFLVALGFSEHIVAWLQISSIPGLLRVAPYTAIIGVIGFMVIGFTIFNDFVNSVYWYLFADVVPQAFLGRFLGLFRVVAIGADFIFQRYILKYADHHMEWIFLGGAMLYLVGFGLMCWRIKEGQYPPVTDLGERPTLASQVKTYFQQCFQHRIYVLVFCCSTFRALANVAGVMTLVFLTSLPGMELAKIGIVNGWISVAGMILAFPAGWLADRFHPLRVTIVMAAVLIPAQATKFFLMQDYHSFVWLQGATTVPLALFDAASLPLLMSIFPRDRYGQFSSANAMLRSSVMVAGGVVAAVFLDFMTGSGQNKDAYRWMYIWGSACYAAMLACLVALYVQWKRHGGRHGYVPPGSPVSQVSASSPDPEDAAATA